ncbi:UTP11-like, U3 small nucleolar ribonucleoprotein [Allomyces arbusculus]|nr:UTP11-like, U3 small nucleolar ribonucleoprotein [Allomyces arbusculus]
MSSTLRKAAPRRTHHERAQPRARQKLGLLEKHKDYVLRAKDYHKKEKRIKAMREKARTKNDDEFYFAMQNAKTKDGVHIIERNKALDSETVALLKSQDKTYLATQRAINARKIEKLQAALPLIGVDMDGIDLTDAPEAKAALASRHTVFVDDEEAAAEFDPAEHFDTDPDLVARRHNRPTRAQIATADTPDVKLLDKNELKRAAKERAAMVAELASRTVRDRQLRKAELELDTQRALMGKGARKKVGVDARGLAIYKWKPDRKK